MYTGYLENNDKSFAYGPNRLNWEEKSSIKFCNSRKKLLIAKNYQKFVFNNFLLEYYQLYKKTARDNNC